MIDWKSIKTAADPIWKPTPNVPPQMNKWMARPANGIHSFAKGDTLQGIADRYGVSHRRLAQANPTVNPNAIRLGAKINIPINERDYFLQTKKFDPENITNLPPNLAHAIRMVESADGKYVRPFGNTSSAKGMYQMLQDRFRVTQALHPEMKGWKHDDLLTDRNKAQQAFDFAMKDNIRRWQYLNGAKMPTNYMIRSWHQPNNIFNQKAIDYEKMVMKKLNEIIRKKQEMLNRMRQQPTG